VTVNARTTLDDGPTDARVRLDVWREALARDLVHALGTAEVAAVASAALRDLVGRPVVATLYALGGSGDPQPRLCLGPAGTIAPTVALDGADVLPVATGPPEDRWVLAVTPDAGRRDADLLARLQAFVHELWVAVQRAELVGDLEGQLEILTAITAVASAADVDMAALIQRVARIASALTDAERVGIYLVDDDGALSVAHEPAAVVPGDGLGVARLALHHAGEVMVLDPSDARIDAPWRSQEGVVALLAAPLRVGGKQVGVLVLARVGHDRMAFSDQSIEVTGALCHQAALAIGHARLFERESATVARLKELDQLKADYVAGVSHDLKSPLTSLLGFATTLRRYGDELAPEDRMRYLASMERQGERLVAMADDLVLAGRIEQGHVTPESVGDVAPTELLREAVESLDPQRRARVHLPDVVAGATVRGDHAQLMRVLTNLIDNAIKYGGDGPIDVALGTADGVVTLAVRDRGPGIAPQDREAIFDRYGRGEQGVLGGSTGLGLYISRAIARGHGGDLVVLDADDGPGVVFRLTLPVTVTPDAFGVAD